MKKLLATAMVAAAFSATAAYAADLKMVTKAPPAPPAVESPWDVAFGAWVASDYNFRGVTQSAHQPAVGVYFEPRYNINKDLQLYVGMGGESIDFPNHAAAEIDFYGGIRPTFGKLALDFGAWYYWYPGGICFNSTVVIGCNASLPNGNVIKGDVSFLEVYAKATYQRHRRLLVRRQLLLFAVRAELGRRRRVHRGLRQVRVPEPAAAGGLGRLRVGRRRLLESWARATTSTRSPASRTASRTRATPPGTWASASPTRCSRSTSATTTPT